MQHVNRQLLNLILETDPKQKSEGVLALALSDEMLTQGSRDDTPARKIDQPGYPSALQLVAPKDLKRRGISTQQGRNILMHSVAHIEYNAINLALDAAYRFRQQPRQYYIDWLRVAQDEARHFQLINRYLTNHDCEYGAYPAHNGLWSMTVETDYDVLARMALVPRVLEARGLDVTPGLIARLDRVEDQEAIDILKVIYQDEVEHVRIGSHWFKYHCGQRNLDPRTTFKALIQQHFHGQLRGPFNIPARLLAGFDEEELAELESINHPYHAVDSPRS
ncbi:hypothetical protein GCM10008090_15150 [Arenicella chitinivorans]|uniref:Ferritin-like domain-containing protein n=1 Tax=Arenicella chitinivorans TaxID=1329800 RepID=A0A918VLL5_9GAMM|nr:ferritin-like domain-containing protein [Arenicella chitinivorans]GHA06443.1 hypothetical protein GCM10008090_15150 [Arenicella chitinivorans]